MDQRMALSIRDVCDQTSLSRPTVERLVAAGTLRSIKVGARRLVLVADLAAFLETGVAEVAA